MRDLAVLRKIILFFFRYFFAVFFKSHILSIGNKRNERKEIV